jgi:hypothetical protein
VSVSESLSTFFPPSPVLKNSSDKLQCLHDLYAYERNLLGYALRKLKETEKERRRDGAKKEVISSEVKEKMRLQ